MKSKKAQLPFGDFIFGFIGLFVLLIVCVSLYPVQQGYSSVENMTNATNNALNTVQNSTAHSFAISENNTIFINIIYSFLNFILYTTFEVTKLALNYGFSHPEFVNAKTLLWLVIFSLLIPLVYYGVKLLAVIFIMLKEIYDRYKDRKKLKALQNKNGKSKE